MSLTPLCVSGLGRACARFHASPCISFVFSRNYSDGRIKVYHAADLSTFNRFVRLAFALLLAPLL